MLWFPPIGTVIAAIYKDTLMASLLVAGTALLVSERSRRHAWGLALIGGATAMRYNAIAATLPIVVYAVSLLSGRRLAALCDRSDRVARRSPRLRWA